MLRIKKEYAEYVSKTFRLPAEIIAKLEHVAVLNNTSLNKVVIQCLEYAIDELDRNVTDETID